MVPTTAHAQLGDGGVIEGTVTSESGVPLDVMDVYVYQMIDGTWTRISDVETGSTGKYRATGLSAGTYRLRTGGDDGYFEEFYENSATIEAADDVDVTANETTSGIDFQLTEQGKITGVVSDIEGEPLRFIEVQLYEYSNNQWTKVTEDGSGHGATRLDGTYEAHVPRTGTYRVGFSDESYIDEFYDDAETVEEGDDVEVVDSQATNGVDATLELEPRGTISGTVSGPDGTGLNPAIVRIYQRGPDGWEKVIPDGQSDFTTNESGDYLVGGLHTGTYRAWFSAGQSYVPEYYSDQQDFASADDISVVAGDAVDVDAQLETVIGRCGGQLPTIVGSGGPITGTPGNDVIIGTAGAEKITGRGGDDLICGRGGDDVVTAGGGDDRVWGSTGNDRLNGDGGHDQLFGEEGADILSGGGGNDQLSGGDGDDRLDDGFGNDELTGGPGNDRFAAGIGRDVCTDVEAGDQSGAC
jgi:Ca2+-binding RTX toxin-like protein